ncbi:MAG: hypothetical protein ACQES8_04765 [Thermodesulfobacteriota bacterium]
MLSKKSCFWLSLPLFVLTPQLLMAEYEEEYHHEDSVVTDNQSPASTPQQTANLVQRDLILPAVKTRAAKEKEAARQALKMPQSFGAALRYQNIDPEGSDDGDLYGANLAMMWDNNALTYGVMVPYDNIDFDNFDANRIGLVGFGQFRQQIQQNLGLTYTGYLNYNNTNVSIGSSDDDINNYGGGLAASLNMDLDTYTLGASLAYQYNKDDSNTDDDDQHLLKTGIKGGYRFGQNTAVALFGIWTCDVTDYEDDPDDDDYFEIGAEVSASLSDTWTLNFGAKDLVDKNDLNIQEVYLGSIWKF